MQVAAPVVGVFRGLVEASHGKCRPRLHVHEVQFLFPRCPGIGVGNHPLAVGRERAVAVVIEEPVPEAFIVLLSHGEQDVRVLFRVVFRRYHQLVVVQPIEVRPVPSFGEAVSEIASIAVHCK